jgi:hypothetical protein
LDESGEVKVSQTSYDYTRPYWDQIGVTIVGRHVFDWSFSSATKPSTDTELYMTTLPTGLSSALGCPQISVP